jgi:hypothetical protein
MFNNVFFENRAVYEIMWKNTVQRDRPQMKIWRMSISCCVPKATNTQSEYISYFFSTATMVARTRFSVTLKYVACLV